MRLYLIKSFFFFFLSRLYCRNCLSSIQILLNFWGVNCKKMTQRMSNFVLLLCSM